MPYNNTTSFNLAAHKEFIHKHGEILRYFIGMKCTCASSMMPTGSYLADPNRANLNCLACKGLGWVWRDGGEIIGMITSISQHKDLLDSGVAAPGDLILSPDLDYSVSEYDKIQLTWPEGVPFEGELVTRSSVGNTDSTLYGVMDVVQCIVVDPVTGKITEYKPGVDFTFDKNTPAKQIVWQGTNIPSPGTVYSLKYQALVDWIAFVPPQPRRERGTNLGQRVIMRKKHLVSFGV